LEAPAGFVRSLSLMDAKLNVRWSWLLKKWVLERKGYLGPEEVSFLRKRSERTFRIAARKKREGHREAQKTYETACQIAEEFDSASRGYRVLFFAKELDRRTFDMLIASDMQRYGGFSRYIEEVESQEARKERDEERQMANEREAMNKDVYDKLQFIWNHRETQLLDGKRSMRDLLS
jgi:hypothetical protein